MPDAVIKSVVAVAESLLKQYNFDPGEQTCDQILDHWLRNYDPRWIRLALIEALYQGRYKTISVEQIMSLWLRRGQPSYRFSHDFEALICTNLPQDLRLPPQARKSPTSRRPTATPIGTQNLGMQNSLLPPAMSPLSKATPANLAKPAHIPPPPQPTASPSPAAVPPEPAKQSAELTLPLQPTESTQEVLADLTSADLADLNGAPESAIKPAKPQLEITKFQPEPATSEVYHKLREIARTWNRSEPNPQESTIPEGQQTSLG
jgi:hypothetical protein